jgi:tRNA A37 methylthiotransferase MiaB
LDERGIRKRAETMRELGKQKRQAFYRQFLNQELSVLIEDRREIGTGRWKGLSRNYIPILLTNDDGIKEHRDRVNQEWTVKVTELTEKGMIGKGLEKERG